MATNLTEVRLCAVPLEDDYKHTISFPDAITQRNYFIGKTVHSAADFSYQRKDHVIRYPMDYDDLVSQGVNYVMYRNTENSSKWYYAFITDMRYINDGVTNISIETDVLQTYMFDYTVQPSFIEREHCDDDTVGIHTIDESLELGEYTVNRHTKANYGGAIYDESIIVIGVTKDTAGNNVTGTFYGGLYSGVKYYGFAQSTTSLSAEIFKFIDDYDKAGLGDAIVAMFMCPKDLVTINNDHTIVGSNLVSKKYINYTGSNNLVTNTTIDITTNKLNGYTPRNNKLKCFPYRYLTVSNNSGVAIPLKYERFYIEAANIKTYIPPEFVIEGCLTPGCSVRLVPLNYNGSERNDDEGVNLGKYPILNWSSDYYTNWLTQNGVNVGIDIASGVAQIAGGIALVAASGGAGAMVGVGSSVSGVTQIARTLAQVHQQSFAPPQVKGNLNAGDVITVSDQNDFHFYDMSIKAEYAKIIDDYFDMFGYKCNRVKLPNTRHRSSWWYTKTIDVAIDGNIPANDMQIIKNCYNNGVTFWRNGKTVGDYTQDNSIV